MKKSIKVFFGRGLLIKISVVVVLCVILMAIFAPVLSPCDPNEGDLLMKNQPASSEHLLGTDYQGRDVLSRIFYGARISLVVSLLSGGVAAVTGILLGLISGYFGKIVNSVIMRVTDAVLAIPNLIFTLVLTTALGGTIPSLVFAIGLSMVPTYIRMVNSQVLTLRESDFISAGKLIGLKDMAILLRHLLPNCFPSLIVLFTMNIGSSILLESSLSYLGQGIAPPTASWGSMVSDGYPYLTTHPMLSILPGIMIILTVVAFNFVGDGLRDSLDPRLKGKL